MIDNLTDDLLCRCATHSVTHSSLTHLWFSEPYYQRRRIL